MKKNINLIILLILIYSCSNINHDDIGAIEYYNIPVLSSENNHKKVLKLDFKISKIDSSLSSSFVGELWVNKNKLYFSDHYFNYVYELDINGNLKNTYLGKGNGPNEIPDLDDIVPNKDGSYTVLSSYSTSIYNFDNSWKRIGKSVIDFNIKRSDNEILQNPDPSIFDSYELETGYDDILRNWNEKYVAISVSASHPSFNGYFDSDSFYKYSRVIALINKNTGKISDFFGRRSPVYLSQKNIPSFNHFKFEIDDKNAYLSFMPDPNIYVINKKTKLAIGKFGVKGNNMKTNYRLTDNYEQAQKNELEDMEIYGYYRDLKIIPEDNLVFRTYSKSKESDNDGLQIYKKFNLIGDINVPKGFKIIGKINNHYIGSIKNNTSDESVSIYKITFNYEN